ncbi:MAG: nucleotide-binding domain containing protein, partial [Burkholderiales bacterium]
QAQLGVERAGQLVESCMAEVARDLVAHGVRRLVVAGGETSGAVVQSLGVTRLRIGPQIDPGVPWTMSLGEPNILLALKSGNFGAPDFFAKAIGMVS